MSIRWMKRVLFIATGWSWLGAGHFLAMVIKYDTRPLLGWLMVMLAVAGALTVASLLSWVMGPMMRPWSAGYEAGRAARRHERLRDAQGSGRRATDLRVAPLRSVPDCGESTRFVVNDQWR